MSARHDSPRATKKPYRKPALQLYGNIRSLTRAVGFISANADGGAMIGMRKTR